MISVVFYDKEIMQALQQLERAAGDISPALKEIGKVLVESTKQRFASGEGPDGQAWAENSPVTIDRKGRNKPLIDEGTLAEQLSYAVTGNQLEVGSSMEYAAMQQFGGTKSEFPNLWGDIPSRPFLGVSESDAEEILAIVHDHLANT